MTWLCMLAQRYLLPLACRQVQDAEHSLPMEPNIGRVLTRNKHKQTDPDETGPNLKLDHVGDDQVLDGGGVMLIVSLPIGLPLRVETASIVTSLDSIRVVKSWYSITRVESQTPCQLSIRFLVTGHHPESPCHLPFNPSVTS